MDCVSPGADAAAEDPAGQRQPGHRRLRPGRPDRARRTRRSSSPSASTTTRTARRRPSSCGRRVNGQIREDGSVAIPSVPPNGEAIAKINLGSRPRARGRGRDRGRRERRPARAVQPGQRPPRRRDRAGIEADNTRYTVVEVRDRVPILLVDNNPTARGTKEAESFFLQKLFTEPIKGYDVQLKSAADLENAQPPAVLGRVPVRRARALGRAPARTWRSTSGAAAGWPSSWARRSSRT